DREDDRSVDRERALYVGVCRIDLVRRAGTARLLSDAHLAATVARALEAAEAPAPASVTVVLTDDEELRDLNRSHLERDEPTDVLSFPMLDAGSYPTRAGRAGRRRARRTPLPTGSSKRVHIGDIAISVERAIEQA